MDKYKPQREYYQRNKEKLKEYSKEYHEKHKEKISKRQKKYLQEYRKTEEGQKINRISNWKQRGIVFHDYHLLYDIYLQTTHCDQCKCLLNQCDKSRKCVDHDHTIIDDENVRHILCNSCNIKRR